MLSKKEKELIIEIWEKLTPVAADIGSDALLRMFASYPGTKTYFSHLDISARSRHLLFHGKKIVQAITEGAKDISQLTVTLAPLQTLHAYQLRIDPTNFKVQVLQSHLRLERSM
ncbi:hemoglobin subunit alpha-D-like [Solea senegalensis]|uniref:Hemoglobin subunit alpha-D-like n=1 Tax=Solea senegalensis TaxID=28829 RepID=A0AAV6RPP6_SOLSE|nr:hemoglobin subunit alpha-D-like [Solea senegalensis]